MSDRPYRGGIGSRREARERALELLYEAESKGLDPTAVVDAQLLRPDVFAVELVEGVESQRQRLDATIGRYAQGWTIERMPVLDVAILRLGIYELLNRPDVPTAAVISEAVELAKRFSTVDSSKFVNGVLSAVAMTERGGEHMDEPAERDDPMEG